MQCNKINHNQISKRIATKINTTHKNNSGKFRIIRKHVTQFKIRIRIRSNSQLNEQNCGSRLKILNLKMSAGTFKIRDKI